MKMHVLDWLVCPVCAGELEIRNAVAHEPIRAVESSPPTACKFHCHAPANEVSALGAGAARAAGQPCPSCYGIEIHSATLVCARGGHSFPVRDGVPRLRLQDMLEARPAAINAPADTMVIAASFEKEWSHFDYENDRTWHQDVDERCQLFLKEVATTADELRGKLVLDAGCGNGSLSRGLNRFGCEVLAADISDSCVAAHQYFAARGNDRTHFVQADLTHPPFRSDCFDVIFSSGVLHHNPNTREALRAIARSLAPGGRIYIWVYGHVPGVAHKLKEQFRRTVSPLPASIKHTIVAAWLPQAMLRQYLRTALRRNRAQDRLKWRERFVLLLDHYTPRYRWEHTPEELHQWYSELGYHGIATTEQRAWGFGVAARRPAKAAHALDATTADGFPSVATGS